MKKVINPESFLFASNTESKNIKWVLKMFNSFFSHIFNIENIIFLIQKAVFSFSKWHTYEFWLLHETLSSFFPTASDWQRKVLLTKTWSTFKHFLDAAHTPLSCFWLLCRGDYSDTESLSVVHCSLWRYYYLQSNSRRDKNYITQHQHHLQYLKH